MSTSDRPTGYTVEVRARRLVAARIHGLADEVSAQAYARELGTVSSRIALTSPILCADHRPVHVYPPAVADELVRLFTLMNRVLTRIAIVVAPTNATLIMQLGRIIREANNPSRQLFTDASKADRFLAEVLDEEGRAALTAFLAG